MPVVRLELRKAMWDYGESHHIDFVSKTTSTDNFVAAGLSMTY